MAKLTIDIGTSPNKGDGDPIRTAFQKINANFNELYAGNFTDPANLESSLIPGTDGAYDLGSTTAQWGDLHVADFIYLGGVRIEVNSNGALLVGGSNPIQTQDTMGSVFGDDSTLLVDGVNGVIPSANISGTEATNWDTAFGWGDHSAAGYAPQATTYTKTEVDLAIAAVDPFSGDVTGSVFADDSTLLVDGVAGMVVGDIKNSLIETNNITALPGDTDLYIQGGIDSGTPGNPARVNIGTTNTSTIVLGAGDAVIYVNGNASSEVAAGTGRFDTIIGDLTGSVFGDDSTLLVDGVNGKITGEVTGTISSTNWMAASDNYLTISNGGSTGPGPIQIVASANLDLSSGTNNDINITPHGSGRVKVSDGAFGIVEAATFIGHADKTMYLSSKTTGAESTHIALDSQSGVATTMYGAVDFVSGGSVDFTGSTVTGLPAAGATEINDLTDVDTATIAPSRSMQPLIWDDIDSNWYPGNGISLTTNLTMEDNSFIMLRKNAYINFEGSTTDGFDTRLEVVDPTANRTVRLPDADGTLALTADIPTALSDFTNDLDYAPIVGGAIQANGLPSGTTFTDTLTLPVLTAEPSSPVNGMVAVADGTSWDPMSNAAQTMVVYLAGAWRQIAQGGV